DPAFDRADRAFADRGRVLIGKAPRAHQNQRFALLVGQNAQRPGRVGQLRREHLILAAAGNTLRGILIPGRLTPGPAPVGIELIAQNGEQPGLQIGAGNESGAALPSLDQGLLRQIVGAFLIAGERAGKSAQKGNERQELGLEIAVAIILAGVGRAVHGGRGYHHDTFLPVRASSASSMRRSKSRKSSGTGSSATSSYMRRSSRPMAL